MTDSNRERDVQIAQLEALGKRALETARTQEITAGEISPEIVGEIYRIGHQIMALLYERPLNQNSPIYLFGLYSALLKLHRKNEKKERTLYGHASPRTVAEIARLEFELERLEREDEKGDLKRPMPEVVAIHSPMNRLLE